MKKTLVGIALAGAMFGLAPLAANASTYTLVGVFDDPNDCPGDLGRPFAQCKIAVTLPSGEQGFTFVVAKQDDDGVEYNTTKFPLLAATLDVDGIDATSGRWSYQGNVGITHFSLKSSTQYAIYKLTTPGFSFVDIAWDTSDLGNKGLSHLSVFDGFGVPPNEIPIPAAAWLLGSGLLAMGAIGRRRMGARA